MADILESLEKDTRPNVGGDRRKHLANIKPEDTLRDYCRRMTRRTYSHVHCVGGPETIADFIGEWINQGACDGFILLPWQFPVELEVFVDQVGTGIAAARPVPAGLSRRHPARSFRLGPSTRTLLIRCLGSGPGIGAQKAAAIGLEVQILARHHGGQSLEHRN